MDGVERGLEQAVRHLKAQELRSTCRRRSPRYSEFHVTPLRMRTQCVLPRPPYLTLRYKRDAVEDKIALRRNSKMGAQVLATIVALTAVFVLGSEATQFQRTGKSAVRARNLMYALRKLYLISI